MNSISFNPGNGIRAPQQQLLVLVVTFTIIFINDSHDLDIVDCLQARFLLSFSLFLLHLLLLLPQHSSALMRFNNGMMMIQVNL